MDRVEELELELNKAQLQIRILRREISLFLEKMETLIPGMLDVEQAKIYRFLSALAEASAKAKKYEN